VPQDHAATLLLFEKRNVAYTPIDMANKITLIVRFLSSKGKVTSVGLVKNTHIRPLPAAMAKGHKIDMDEFIAKSLSPPSAKETPLSLLHMVKTMNRNVYMAVSITAA
jgi:hypothetical protein